MYYTIYKIVNQIDGKFYIGSHKTKDLNDTYMGSGKYLKYAQEKYGVENFSKILLFVFETAEEMYAKEAEIVNEEFLATHNTYNLKIGGFGGWDYVNNNNLHNNDPLLVKKRYDAMCSAMIERYGENWRSKKITALTPEAKHVMYQKIVETKRRRGYKSCTKQMCTPAAMEAKKITYKQNSHQAGEKNSQYGKMWITNGTDSQSIPKSQDVPEGWRRGRVIASRSSQKNY